MAWSITNYFFYHIKISSIAFWAIRLEIFSAVWLVVFLFRFLYLIPTAGCVAILTLTPYVFEKVTTISPDGSIAGIQNGPAIFIFVLFSVLMIFTGLLIFVRKMRSSPEEARAPFRPILWGLFATFVCVLTFNMVLPAFYGIAYFVPLGALFILPTVVGAAYAIRAYHLFNVKVFATAALVCVLAVVILLEAITSSGLWQLILQGSVFILVLSVGISLIQSVIREVEQREQIQKLADELTEINKRQEGLIHFIGHEVKGFLTKAQGTFSLLVDGDLGQMPDTMRPFVERALQDTKDGVTSVSDILKASNMKKGTVTFAKEPFDLKALAEEAVERARQTAEGKGLKLSFTAEGDRFQMTGDKGEIRDHVLRNLIDNAVNYTPSGSIDVSLKKAAGKYVFVVKDTGVGITPEDKARLFTEGGHGKESQKVNVHSTGYGLFIAKQVTDAHGGTIRAESEGSGHGSTFIAEFPQG
jgi:signal transduction histidine kinase